MAQTVCSQMRVCGHLAHLLDFPFNFLWALLIDFELQ